MDTGSSIGSVCQINHKISNLSVEIILVLIPVLPGSGRYVWIRIEKIAASERRGSYQYWQTEGISNHLSVIPKESEIAENMEPRFTYHIAIDFEILYVPGGK